LNGETKDILLEEIVAFDDDILAIQLNDGLEEEMMIEVQGISEDLDEDILIVHLGNFHQHKVDHHEVGGRPHHRTLDQECPLFSVVK